MVVRRGPQLDVLNIGVTRQGPQEVVRQGRVGGGIDAARQKTGPIGNGVEAAALQQVHRQEHHQRDDLDRDELTGAVATQPDARRVAPIGHVVHEQRREGGQEHRPLARDLDADRDEPGHRAQPGLRDPEEPGRLSAEPIRRQLRRGFAVQVEAERVTEREACPRRPGGELDTPGADQTVEREQREREEVTHPAQSEQSPSG